MSNDLIHRREVLSVLEKIFETYRISFCKGPGGFADAVAEAINDIPTAYDVDKVVEQLKKETEDLTSWAEDMAYQCAIDKAIEIVKEGWSKEERINE